MSCLHRGDTLIFLDQFNIFSLLYFFRINISLVPRRLRNCWSIWFYGFSLFSKVFLLEKKRDPRKRLRSTLSPNRVRLSDPTSLSLIFAHSLSVPRKHCLTFELPDEKETPVYGISCLTLEEPRVSFVSGWFPSFERSLCIGKRVNSINGLKLPCSSISYPTPYRPLNSTIGDFPS